ncbi:hypothetical protein [Amorphus orientalis]|uniref:Uncharacterized protein n=1 Tax=Amorphus orientalis TaxID=649198 RepID=A0AAE3VN59_9HYPH|nr:hypothetical protein [Amorphus orientalis]MDQ0314815.1 hypothetical protein [Amorphus orientalis]
MTGPRAFHGVPPQVVIDPAELSTRAEDVGHLNTAARCVRMVLARLAIAPAENAAAIARGEAILDEIGALQEQVSLPSSSGEAR